MTPTTLIVTLVLLALGLSGTANVTEPSPTNPPAATTGGEGGNGEPPEEAP